jgi:Fe-S-cluster containining protein
MAPFICDRCGKCCVSLGQSITIERQLNERDYYCRSKIDHAIFLAHVDEEFREEIADEFLAAGSSPGDTGKNPCRFLRRSPSGTRYCCAIYATRPKVCQDFLCYHMLIRTRDGAICGRVIGKTTLRTEDPELEQIWNVEVNPVPFTNALEWIKQVTAILAGHGYRAESVE